MLPHDIYLGKFNNCLMNAKMMKLAEIQESGYDRESGSEKGLFTFYKEEEQYEKYLRNLEKQRKQKKNKSKGRNKSKKGKLKAKSQTKIKPSEQLPTIRNHTEEANIDPKQSFLRQIVHNKLKFSLQKTEPTINLKKRILLTEGCQPTPLLELAKVNISSIHRYHRAHQDSDNLGPTRDNQNQQLSEPLKVDKNKVKLNFYKANNNIDPSQCSVDSLRNLKLSEFRSKEKSKVNDNHLPSIHSTKLSQALDNLEAFAKKNKEIAQKYSTNKKKKGQPIKSSSVSSYKEPSLAEQSSSTIPKINLAQLDKSGLYESPWEIRRKGILKKLGTQNQN